MSLLASVIEKVFIATCHLGVIYAGVSIGIGASDFLYNRRERYNGSKDVGISSDKSS